MSEKLYWEVRPSGIHNSGLFAARLIPEGAYVIEYLGNKISKEESQRRALAWEAKARKSGEGLVYIFELNDKEDLDGNIEDNPAKFANHHCDPNCEAVNDEDKIWFVATRDIAKGEELTFDYGYGIENFLDHPCLCGSSNCVGFIVRRDQRWRVRRILKGRRERGTLPPPGKA